MAQKIEQLKFNLTSDMLKILLKFNSLESKYKKTNDPKILKDLNSLKNLFIEEFRIYNKKEIEEYLKLREK